ncbi:MAG: FHA domain-containing protein [Labilithrix sp.]|nr:FHA domain-containing protein [Labilithrix sp.]MCW5817345.1 FHA domain-containing protein [Labilithrix sp.]
MGLLRRKGAGADEPTRYLRDRQSIGREVDNDVVIARSSVSGRHATLTWTTSGWVLKDTSTHGTLVNGALVRGFAQPLAKGDELTFVEVDEVWVLADDAPPGLVLTPEVEEHPVIHVEHEVGLRALPSESSPEVTILQLGDGWFVEDEAGNRRRILDGGSIELAGIAYRASVPRVLVTTAEPENPASPFALDTARFEIAVLRGEDEAELTIRSGAQEKTVKPSRPLYLLAYLAEQRIRATEDEGGWLPTDLACRDLGVDRTILNVDVHRIREAVKATGLIGGANVVERRPSQIRIGVPATRCAVVRR